MDSNPHRGEVSILLDEKPYPMRPSYEAMRAIESQTGKSLQAILVAHAREDVGLTLDELAVIVTEGIRAAGREREDQMLIGVKVEKVGQMIYESGFVNALAPVETFLLNAVSGGMKADGKKATAATSVTDE